MTNSAHRATGNGVFRGVADFRAGPATLRNQYNAEPIPVPVRTTREEGSTARAARTPSAIANLAAPHADSLCDACFGRMFARVPPPRSNAERGREIRAEVGGAAPVACPLCEGLLGRVPTWVGLCLSAAEGYEYASFLVGCVVFEEIRKREEAIHARLVADDGSGFAATYPAKPNSPAWTPAEWLKNEINRDVGRALEGRTGKRVDFGRPELTFRLDTRFDHATVHPADLFAKGRYRKLVRDLPQTRWPCRACNGIGCRQCGGTGKTYESSVEELVAAPAVEASGAEGEAFHGMGREDIDARALGNGRPFVLELKRPRRRGLPWAEIQARINRDNAGRVEVERLGPAGPDDAARYKAADPDKTYRARCEASEPLPRAKLLEALKQLSGTTLEQRTPQRVAHRRSDLVRKRKVHAARLVDGDGADFTLEIHAEAGTYIKELVSGDEGRTQPSLSALVGVPVRVAELDVLAIDWPDDP